jgi:predicted 2-oxoglutarate/Fe(II)-dependent dioxygenase YbiX
MHNPLNINQAFLFDLLSPDGESVIVEDIPQEVAECFIAETLKYAEDEPPQDSTWPRTRKQSKVQIVQNTDYLKVAAHIAQHAILNNWKINGEMSVSDFGFFCYKANSHFPAHCDNANILDDGTVEFFSEHRKITCITYLNDYAIDYEGGELCFPELDLEFKPRKYSMIIFPSNVYFRHAVNLITKGERTIFAFFLDVK